VPARESHPFTWGELLQIVAGGQPEKDGRFAFERLRLFKLGRGFWFSGNFFAPIEQIVAAGEPRPRRRLFVTPLILGCLFPRGAQDGPGYNQPMRVFHR
jgi:hypothetical protein